MNALQSYVLSKKYVLGVLDGVELIQGKNCQIQSITDVEGGHKIEFAYYDNDDVLKPSSLIVLDGAKGDKGDTGATGATGATGPRGGGALIDDTQSSSDYVYSSAKVDSIVADVREIANGKTATFVISDETNTDFDSQNDTISVASFTDINGDTFTAADVSVGDIVLVTDQDVPDRWVGSITNDTITLYKLETIKVDLTNYLLRSEIDYETWTFTLADNTTITRRVVIASGN